MVPLAVSVIVVAVAVVVVNFCWEGGPFALLAASLSESSVVMVDGTERGPSARSGPLPLQPLGSAATEDVVVNRADVGGMFLPVAAEELVC
jgi:hypothetical protein